ncbi:hypothetical protein JCM10207_001696 [Rhodosporidiobolus poonsookiae]
MRVHPLALSVAAAVALPAAAFGSQQAIFSSDAALYEQATSLIAAHPLVDGHVDLPYVVRHLGKSPLEVLPELKEELAGHVDITKLRRGGVGAVFNIAYAPCDAQPTGDDFLEPTNAVEWAMESIDVIHRMVEMHSDDLALALTAQDVRSAFAEGKIASLIGLEGSHHLMNSLAILRLFSQLGVRYLTLTHTCHTSFASSAGDGSQIDPIHPNNGLTEFGFKLIPELNRLGMMVDLSHVSDQTMLDAISLSKAPVIFSHSGARAIHDHPRNVPDEVLRLIGSGADQNHGIVMVVFYPSFVDPSNPTVVRVADHIEHIASVCGKKHVGLGSDFDGMRDSVEGLEDASKFPNLIVELLRRGWSEPDLVDLIGGNLLRVMEDVEAVQAALADEPASAAVYDKRRDLPVQWAGPGEAYLPEDVRREVHRRFGMKRDEL